MGNRWHQDDLLAELTAAREDVLAYFPKERLLLDYLDMALRLAQTVDIESLPDPDEPFDYVPKRIAGVDLE